uniref:Uncharacterized protein n=1 Tax=uncultured prokaryote TaxID=198431 RepID=A0A0H5QLX8_9ZZZZ|nr:hypothetical protein [uncultured prokaryote]
MPVFAFDVIFQHDNGLPEDRYVNGWHFSGAGPFSPTDYDNVRDMLADFYTDAGTHTNALSLYFTDEISSPAVVKAYDLSDTPPRAPVYESTFTFSPPSNSPLPFECAIVASFEAEKVSGLPQSRRRNRVYLGPLSDNTVATTGLINGGTTTAIVGALQDLWDAADTSVSWDWVVYSPTLDSSYPVHNGWCDNAFDTQRRRGIGATSRTSATF